MFGAKDLTLFLPDKAGDLTSLRHTKTESDSLDLTTDNVRNKIIDVSKKVTRYFPGKAPVWMKTEEDNIPKQNEKVSVDQGTSNVDRRLARLVNSSTSSTNPNPTTRRRRVVEAEVIALESVEEVNPISIASNDKIVDMDEIEEDEYPFSCEISGGRSSFEQQTQQQTQQDSYLPVKRKIAESVVLNAFSNHAVESDEEETDSSSVEDTHQFNKPVFVPKRNRTTIKDDVQEELALSSKLEKKVRDVESRREQTREMVATIIRANESKESEEGVYDEGQPDDTDDPDDVEQVSKSIYKYIMLIS